DPSKTKYSPFCGITGYRLFPKDKSMMPDSIGTKDVMAVVVSKEPLDWFSLNQQISKNPQQDYAQRLNGALGANLIRAAIYQGNSKGIMQVKADGDGNKVVACIIEISKR